MKVFLTGGTGVVGRSLVPALVAAGHDVRAVCRREEAAVTLRAAGADPMSVDLFDARGDGGGGWQRSRLAPRHQCAGAEQGRAS